MPATVSELIHGKAPPLTIAPSELLATALALMSENDYSQLPVAGSDRKPIALLTIDCIARALNHFGTVPSALRVLDAMDERFERCDAEDELLDVLDALQRASAVLVLSPQQEITGIITSFDAMEYFRRRSQDIMLVQDIEETIKDFVLAAFRTQDATLDQAKLTAAIEDITPSTAVKLRGPFAIAVRSILAARQVPPGPEDERLLARAFDEHLNSRQPAKPFDRLSLNEYIELLLHGSRWNAYGPAFGVERDALKRLLESVRDTRNDLAHFRTDLEERQRDELLFCKDWLTRHEEALKAAVAPQHAPGAGTPAPPPPAPIRPDAQGPFDAALEELDDDSQGSRYAALGARLRNVRDSEREVLTFSEIETLIGAPLPASARQYRAWWSNNERGHAQAKQWLDEGWRVAEVNSREQSVTFVRNREREAEYREFFAGLSEKLRATGSFPQQRTPTGASWHMVAQAPEAGPRAAMFVVSFARGKRLRIELYVDTGDQQATKRIFDALFRRKAELEAAVGEPLSWERLDHRRASRVALYYPGYLLDRDALPELQSRAAASMVRFRTAFAPAFSAAVSEPARAPGA